MVSFASSVASQIGSLIASCNPTNFKSVATELSQLTVLYGSDGSVILLRICLEQVDLRHGNTRHSQLRLQLLTLVLEKLLELPNFPTLLSQALAQIKLSQQFLVEFVKAVKLSSSGRIWLGLALLEVEDPAARQEGSKILESEVPRLLESPTTGVSVDLISRLLIHRKSNKSAVKVDAQKLIKAFPSLQSHEEALFTLAPLVHEEVNEVNCLRNFSNESFGAALDLASMARDISGEVHAAGVMEELGYSCTSSLQHCLEVFSQFPVFSEDEVARIVGMVARTHTGLEDRHGSHGTLSAALEGSLAGGVTETGTQAFWNLDALMEAIQHRAPGLNWTVVMARLDHDNFFLPDQKAFTVLLTLYSMATTEAFPITAICGRPWVNAEGQLSFLRYATAAPPELFTFAHAPRTQPPVDGLHGHKSPVGTPNRAWLCLDLLENLCRQAEEGHVAAVRAILEYPLKHCPEVLLLGLAQVKTEWNLMQSEILAFLLPTYLANNPNSSTVLHLLWPLNRDAVMKAMVDVHSKDSSQVSRILDVCQDLKVLSVVLENTPFSFAIDLAALASRREYLNLEKWLQDMISIHRDSLFQACLMFLKERTLAEPRLDGSGGLGQRANTINLSLETTAIFFRVLQSSCGKLASRELAEEMKRLWAAALRANPRLHSIGAPEQPTTSEVFASDIEEEANSYFQKIYVGKLDINNVVEMLKRFSRSSTAREQEIFACMIQSLFDEYRFFSRYPEKELVITAILFGSLIKHQLVSSITLGIALRCVLDALRKPLDSKMFQFGLKALEQFKDRLMEWPQYCNHILQIAHMRDAHPDIVDFIERTLNRLSGQAELIPSGSTSLEQQQAAAIQAMTSSMGLSSEAMDSGTSGSTGAGEARAVERTSAMEAVEQFSEEQQGTGALPSSASQSGPASVQSAQMAVLFPQSHQAVQDKELQQEDTHKPAEASQEAGPPSEQRLPEQVQEVAAAQVSADGAALPPMPVSDQQPQVVNQPVELAAGLESQVASVAGGAKSVSEAPVAAQESASGPEKQGLMAVGQAVSAAAAQLQSQQQAAVQPAVPAKQEMLRSLRGNAGGARPSASPGFGHALNIETLVAAAEKRESPMQVPSSDLQDKVAFIINNISISNLEGKAKEMQELLTEEYFPWFAQYMVMKRASIEPNFHELYLKFLDKFGNKNLLKDVQKATYENCKVLLRSELIKSSSEERSLLKNLGSWLGKLTIGRNQALRAKEIDPKSLIIEAYEKGLMIAIIPFTSKILEPCASSLAYQPPNPWTMGILGLLAEIYNLPNLKMNLKFDIEVLFKNLAVEMKDVKATQLLKGRERVTEGNPDFSNKDLAAMKLQPPPPEPVATTPASLPAQLELSVPGPLAAAGGQPPLVSAAQAQASIGFPPTSQQEVEDKALAPTSAERPTLSPTPSQPYSLPQTSLMPNNLLSYLVFNAKLGGLTEQLQLPRIVPAALERAIREIISPVVDRAATIACMTTRELVLKDYAMEADESRTLKAAHQMMFSLGGSLAHVTCKEPLRVAFANHLRTLLQAANAGGDVESAVQLLTNDNLDLGCAVIEKATTEKSERDLEETLAQQLDVRRKQRETLGAAFYDASIYSQGNLARLPEALRPKPGRLSATQQRVYDGFASLSWQNQAAARAQAASPAQQPAAPPPPAAQQAMAGASAARAAFNVPPGQSGQPSFMSASKAPGSTAQPLGAAPPEAELERSNLPAISTALPSPTVSTEAQQAAPELAVGLFSGGSALTPEVVTSESAVPADVSPKMQGAVQPSPSSSSLDQLNASEPSLTTGEAIEKYQFIAYKLDAAMSKAAQMNYTALPADHEIRAMIMEVQEVITQCISREEAALAIAQKVFKRLYETGLSPLHVGTHLAILESIREVCKRVVKELTNWVIYSDEERKFNKEISIGLIQSELVNLTDYNMHLAKLMDGGRNAVATDFAIHLVKTCVIQESVVSATELYNVIETLGKIAQRPGAPEALQQVVDLAKNSTAPPPGGAGISKDEKSRATKDKKAPVSRAAVVKEESKPVVKDIPAPLPPGFREQIMALFDEWARICDSPGSNDKAYALYMAQIQHSGMLKGDEAAERFFRILTELAVSHCLASESSTPATSGQPAGGLSFTAVDIYAKLVVLLVKYYADPGNPNVSKINLLNKVLMVTVKLVHRDADEKKTAFNSKPYFRLFVNWLMDFNSPDPVLDSSNFQVLTAFATTLQALQPLRVPAFSFAWLELISHRVFMPKLLLANQQKGWPWFQRLLVALFKFMEPYLRNAELSDPVRLLYKGTLRVLLVLLHDFPEFLCDHHFSFCDVIPPSCIQMRNLILSAFPRNMRLPDPFTPNLKVDLLPEISQPPRILSDVEAALRNKQIKADIDEYLKVQGPLKSRQPVTFLAIDLKQRLLLPQVEAAQCGTRYNVPLMNALVLYIGMQAIQQLQNKSPPQQLAVPTAPITHSAPMDIFQRLIADLDTEGRYLFLNAIANQLRYPNNHTHYFSCVLLYLFAEAQQEIVQEQITRVLLERLIVNRPHPWGLLITFIELIKNPRYNFWSHGFTRCAPEIEKLFESVARSCMGPPPKPEDDGGLASDQLKL